MKTSNLEFGQKLGCINLPSLQQLPKGNSSHLVVSRDLQSAFPKTARNLHEMEFCRKAESLADSSEQDDEFSIVLNKLEDFEVGESVMK